MRAVTELYAGRTPTIADCFKEAIYKLGSLVTACLTVFGILLLPLLAMSTLFLVFNSFEYIFFMAIVFFFYSAFILVVTYVMYPAVILENCGGFSAVARSIELVQGNGNFWRVAFVVFLYSLCKGLINAFVSTLAHNQQGTINSQEGYTVDVSFGSGGDGALSVFVAMIFATFTSM